MRVLDLFSGIGGFSLGLEQAGMETVAFCEIEPYCQKVLAKHWPDVPIYDDVRTITRERLESDGITGIDVITGGFPCQDISLAGKQAGITGERSGLWSELARIIDDIRPKYAIMENVTALISGDRGRWFGRVLGDLAEIGYDAEWHCIPASELGAHHHRDRVWIIAYPECQRPHELPLKAELTKRHESLRYGTAGGIGNVAHPFGMYEQREQPGESNQEIRERPEPRQIGSCCYGEGWWSFEPGVGRVANGVPNRSHRLKGLGNAVVPQIPEIIGRAIMEIEA